MSPRFLGFSGKDGSGVHEAQGYPGGGDTRLAGGSIAAPGRPGTVIGGEAKGPEESAGAALSLTLFEATYCDES